MLYILCLLWSFILLVIISSHSIEPGYMMDMWWQPHYTRKCHVITKIQEHGGQKYNTNQLSPPKVSVMKIRRNQSTFATKQTTYGDQISFRKKDYARLNLQDQMCYKTCMCFKETCRNTTTLKLFLVHAWVTRTLINEKEANIPNSKV